MSELPRKERQVLLAVDDAGATAQEISSRIGDPTRTGALSVGRQCIRLAKLGLVRLRDGGKPRVWVRTPEGASAVSYTAEAAPT